MSTEERKKREVEHGKKVASDVNSYWNYGSPAKQKRADYRASLLISAAGISRSSRVLEIGCGTGEYTSRLAQTGAQITAIDLSPDLVRLAEENNQFPNVRFRVGDAEHLEPLGSFDAIVGNAILHHLDAAKTFSQIFKVLAPGGRFAFSEPNMLNPQIMVQKNVPPIKRLLGDSPDETAFFRWRVRAQVEAAGFSEVRVENVDFTHPSLPLPVYNLAYAANPLLLSLPLVKEFSGSLLISGQKPRS